uniref:Reverse transcriptase domain-containing protein n=1 Tax=Tanacetum cinerariifolium TaxID=118510 RepID=A0A6L2LF89_TANCI|nr:hypothetical protein [Tanacetum cinerariifolium]
MAASVIPILSDSYEESVGSHVLRVILFGAIYAIIPVVHAEVPIVPADPLVFLGKGENSPVKGVSLGPMDSCIQDSWSKILGNSYSDEEALYVQAFNDAVLLEERFLKHKAKVDWLRDGDANTAYFHKSVKSRVNDVAAIEMIREVSDQEIKDAIFSIGNDKSPGPDGYTAAFFKEVWDIISKDIMLAIREFFVNGKLLKELNLTIIALMPKVSSLARVNDYRPISCCNVLFKCISKIIANRIKESLKTLVSSNQSAFVPGRNIADNSLLTEELMHNYHLDRGPPRCAFKVDIQKAYDTVDWNFLKVILLGFGFHDRLVGWIMECVTSTSFSININGLLHGYFNGKRGLHQGDPLSPYLFTLVMEILTLMIRRRVQSSDSFMYHRYCSKLEIVNLCFADDLFLFAHGDTSSTKVIMKALDEFKNVSGLTPSLPKSKAYFCNVLNHVKLSILQILPFEEDRLPVKYLGVPLVSSGLIIRDCKELIEKVQNRVDNWKNKSLYIVVRAEKVKPKLRGMLFVFRERKAVLGGFNHATTLSEVIVDGHFIWPNAWHSSFPDLNSIVVPILRIGVRDKPKLRNLDGVFKPFSVSAVWHVIRPRGDVVLWYHCVWFTGYIPRHAFNMWLIMKRRLKTQDMLRAWDNVDTTKVSCALCELQADSHDHLFFECLFSTQVWHKVRVMAGLPSANPLMDSIIHDILPFANRKNSKSVCSKLVLAASAYFIWQERNNRLFRNERRSVDQVVECILNSMRLKLVSCRWKKSKAAMSGLVTVWHVTRFVRGNFPLYPKKVGKFTFSSDFVILKIEEDNKVPLILGRPFLHTVDAVIQVKQKQLNLRVETERMIFNIVSAMKHSYSNNDTCFSVDVIDEILEQDFEALLDE